ncbi:MAB_1171c family putative transporter [Streptomyces sp. NPDC089919]|uniref:MAB_1171c family putative transporter n=1 Tax=Streptomyces sp. NPDC089919 TaxID=3155188 RepID=UPI00344839AD
MQAQHGISYYVPAAVVAVALAIKFPGLLRGRHIPMVRAVNAVLALVALGFFFSAPPTVTVVNQLTGIDNFSAPLVHSLMCAHSCACLVLLENWREDARAAPGVRRRVRGWLWGCGVVIAAVIVCFVLGDVPAERPEDFDTYYANTPYIREMLVLYLVAHIVATSATTVLCWKWAREIRRDGAGGGGPAVDRSLRLGLVVLVFAYSFNLAFGALKLTAVVARWTGRDWDALNRGVTQFIAVDGLVIAAGFLVPVVGPRLATRLWQPWRTHRTLGPLQRAVRPPAPAPGRVELSAPWYAGPEQRLMHRMTTIHDGLLELREYCADEVREQGYQQARAGGAREAEAVAAGFATMFAEAADRRRRDVPAEPGQSSRAAMRLRAAEAEYRDLVVRIARAMPAGPARAGT